MVTFSLKYDYVCMCVCVCIYVCVATCVCTHTLSCVFIENLGHAVAEAGPLLWKARFNASPCGICSGQSSTGRGYSLSTVFFSLS
jgi:hypothetical protein